MWKHYKSHEKKSNAYLILPLYIYYPAKIGAMRAGMIGMIIGPTSRGFFPGPSPGVFRGRKNFALLTRCERASWVSVSLCMSLVCLKSKCIECVWLQGDHDGCG